MATLAPSAASRSAVAAPIPRLAPVTTAFRPRNLSGIGGSVWRQGYPGTPDGNEVAMAQRNDDKDLPQDDLEADPTHDHDGEALQDAAEKFAVDRPGSDPGSKSDS